MDDRESVELRVDDGRPCLATEAVRLELDPDNRPVLSLTRLRSIGVVDLHEVASHTVVRDGAGSTHQLEFVDGGVATVAYTESGKLRELLVERCGATVTADGEVLLSLYNVPSQPGVA